ncbi:hypothetical protein BB558_003996 [Smittium angustum]|uniref:Non-specific serine/threonine protein kinase n=1 Tax=Smittium angustum TaxID=133377 RepID=A0A2U1J4J6_SMIAN|nr:hypothetical protein BB558_003996 [Smittium angustum]
MTTNRPEMASTKKNKTNFFGQYLLLHTIGEGEFAKVKLALHRETGEEFAIKLVKKEWIDTEVKLTKIKREISALKAVDHKYIVKLNDIIETEKYIGLVLEYASGGELFEHILAHRYLRERDACRLFAQLISAENLLLDWNRNIKVTDFGFANHFDAEYGELMMTSCGSPCYAAPELVVSNGMYAGTVVDVWSCGVILYAMLAGYLPFDDDPSNPDGDNINQLYKYILSTELVFPDHISSSARHLLRKMLVPNPAHRATIAYVRSHKWLQPYSHYFNEANDSHVVPTFSNQPQSNSNDKINPNQLEDNPSSIFDPIDSKNTILDSYSELKNVSQPNMASNQNPSYELIKEFDSLNTQHSNNNDKSQYNLNDFHTSQNSLLNLHGSTTKLADFDPFAELSNNNTSSVGHITKSKPRTNTIAVDDSKQIQATINNIISPSGNNDIANDIPMYSTSPITLPHIQNFDQGFADSFNMAIDSDINFNNSDSKSQRRRTAMPTTEFSLNEKTNPTHFRTSMDAITNLRIGEYPNLDSNDSNNIKITQPNKSAIADSIPQIVSIDDSTEHLNLQLYVPDSKISTANPIQNNSKILSSIGDIRSQTKSNTNHVGKKTDSYKRVSQQTSSSRIISDIRPISNSLRKSENISQTKSQELGPKISSARGAFGEELGVKIGAGIASGPVRDYSSARLYNGSTGKKMLLWMTKKSKRTTNDPTPMSSNTNSFKSLGTGGSVPKRRIQSIFNSPEQSENVISTANSEDYLTKITRKNDQTKVFGNFENKNKDVKNSRNPYFFISEEPEILHQMRTHQGAIDPLSISSLPPSELFQHVLQTLDNLGLIVMSTNGLSARVLRPKLESQNPQTPLVIGATYPINISDDLNDESSKKKLINDINLIREIESWKKPYNGSTPLVNKFLIPDGYGKSHSSSTKVEGLLNVPKKENQKDDTSHKWLGLESSNEDFVPGSIFRMAKATPASPQHATTPVDGSALDRGIHGQNAKTIKNKGNQTQLFSLSSKFKLIKKALTKPVGLYSNKKDPVHNNNFTMISGMKNKTQESVLGGSVANTLSGILESNQKLQNTLGNATSGNTKASTKQSPEKLAVEKQKAHKYVPAKCAPVPPPYGETYLDAKGEVQFIVEVCKLKNLSHLFVVTLTRRKGSAWTYKYLYNLFLESLELSKYGSYMTNPFASIITPIGTLNHKDGGDVREVAQTKTPVRGVILGNSQSYSTSTFDSVIMGHLQPSNSFPNQTNLDTNE